MLAVAVVANLVSYWCRAQPGTVLGTGYDAREIAAVLPLGAVLAGRVFGTAAWPGGVLASLPGRADAADSLGVGRPGRRATGPFENIDSLSLF